MIRVEGKQGTDAWRKARLGVVTASGFDRLLTPATLKPAGGRAKYLHELAAEWLLGRPLEDGSTGWMARGTGLEPEARGFYAVEKGVEVEEVGFLLRDDKLIGCSPDGLIEDAGGLEIKCPKAETHVGYLLDHSSLVAAYRGQLQGGLLITGRRWWDILSYNPEMPPVIMRVTRDAKYLAAIEPILSAFLECLAAAKARLSEAAAAMPANPFSDLSLAEARRARADDGGLEFLRPDCATP